MPDRSWAAAAAALVALAAAPPAEARSFDIAPGPLGEVIAAIGVQARITIAILDPELASHRSPGVKGDVSVRAALDRALRGTGAEAVFYDRATVRIIRSRPRPKPSPRPKPRPPKLPATEAPPVEIIVSATKQTMHLDNFPGTAKIIDLEAGRLARKAGDGTAAIAALQPTLTTTNLGRGRNKLFVRGIADSSFNGPTQATVGQYLGDVRLTYNAPDPDLNLYDLERVEILAGPQGTLYGAGSIGGIVRLVPNTPDSTAAYASASAGLSATRFGGIGGDAAAMANLPILKGQAAVRLVVHGGRDAGYIDDPSRGLRDINSGRNFGQRLLVRIDDIAGWTIDLGGVHHRVETDDGQYLIRGQPPLTRSNPIAQPFGSRFQLAYLTARRPIGATELVSTSSVVWQDMESAFDATGSDGTSAPLLFRERNDITFWSHETRLAGGGTRMPWVAGLAGVYNINRLTRSLGPPDAPRQITGVRNRQLDLSLYGQATLPFTRSLDLMMGGRFALGNGGGRLLGENADESSLSSKTHFKFSATVALDWRLSPSLSLYSNYQEGFRAGGLAIAPAGSATGSQEFVSDELSQIEIGARWRDKDRDGFSARAAIFRVDWNNIQADLVDTAGLPYTANIGNGLVYGLDGELNWRVSKALALTVSAFLNESYLYDAPAEFANPDRNTLPNIPTDGVRLGAEWRLPLGRGIDLSGDASLRYVGRSNLGAGPSLDVTQGDYYVGDVGARLDFSRFGLSLDISNIADTRANTFAFGNPFGLAREDQITPLRPRTVRLGIDTRF